MIKLNVPLKAIGIEIYTACNFFFFPPVLFRSISLSFSLCLILYLSLSSLNQRKHTLIVRINESPNAVIMFWPCSTDKSHHRSSPLEELNVSHLISRLPCHFLHPIHLKRVFMPLGKVTVARDSGISENT